ncbi:hypothetical protein [Vibrio parahaemolyticus]|uniref:hypothetical protein n=1 Tax=Vibrio parahaemolyticus TaxID=670 RepID=UPI001120E0E7|nr:hypothetical protein [Vibrio parahaemolyticus]TOI27394.1 hypothetical protein CGI62_24050 [Vibrio parahaemolyticus]
MTIISISQDVPLANYNSALFLASTLSAVFFIFLVLSKKYSVTKSSIYTSLLFTVFYYAAYSQVDKFYQLSLNGNYIKLKYAPPSKDKLILKTEVKSVTFGVPGKTGRSCYIALNLLSGEKYKSASIVAKVEYCKNVRAELQKQLTL